MIAPLSASEIAAGRDNDRIGTELVLAENGMRVWHLILMPGETIPAHRHDRPYLWTVLTDSKGRSRYGDGRIVEHDYKAGETKSFPDLSPGNAFVHDLSNIGTTQLTFVTVEFDR
jgi:hypothetical protein